MKKEDLKFGSIIVKKGTNEPRFYLGESDEYGDFVQYHLIREVYSTDQNGYSMDYMYVSEKDILSDYELYEPANQVIFNKETGTISHIEDNDYQCPSKELNNYTLLKCYDITTLEQSKILLESGISVNNADFIYKKGSKDGDFKLDHMDYNDNGDALIGYGDIPAWSLPRLEGIVLVKGCELSYKVTYKDGLEIEHGDDLLDVLVKTLKEIHKKEPKFNPGDYVAIFDDCDDVDSRMLWRIFKIKEIEKYEYLLETIDGIVLYTLPISKQDRLRKITIN